MFSKVLVANRGEIAIRVLRACRELGIGTVAVYSDADLGSPHVFAADESVRIGPAPSSESYLRGDRIIDAARACGAQAIHPGYGFLSEREWFARAVEDAGLVFIGPTADAIARMGSKTAARTLAESAGVPVVPGVTTAVADAGSAREIAGMIGLPVLLKAAAGGGGKGMRVVQQMEQLENALDAARREAKTAFGDEAVYIEKYIARPRHVEIQVLADHHGNVVHLGERECSIQRRHQKMIEESPSPVLDAGLRAEMGATAVRMARAAGYTNAGTCEFLLDSRGNFYFLEMNTRLQVEHPVTELVYGVDLVHLQLRIAAGEPLPLRQSDIQPRGWAMECRITSESAGAGFLPSTGRISELSIPAGPGVRWDGGITRGTNIGPHYDPLLGKLIVWAPDRMAAIARMTQALEELVIVGLDSTRDFHAAMMRDPEFIAGDFDVQWLERRMSEGVASWRDEEFSRAAAIAAVLLARETRPADGAPAMSDSRARVDGWPRPEWNTADQPGHA